MKKIYVVLIKRYTDCEGRNWRIEREYVNTNNIAAYIELKKSQIESHSYGWMDYCKGADDRPYVKEEELEIKVFGYTNGQDLGAGLFDDCKR